MLQTLIFTLLKGDKVIEIGKEISDSALFSVRGDTNLFAFKGMAI